MLYRCSYVPVFFHFFIYRIISVLTVDLFMKVSSDIEVFSPVRGYISVYVTEHDVMKTVSVTRKSSQTTVHCILNIMYLLNMRNDNLQDSQY